MKQKATQNRRILQVPVVEGEGSDLSGNPMNGSSETTIRRNPMQPTSPLDISMALTILVLLTVLFFMGFFSIYIRRLAEEDSADARRRRHPSRPATATAGLHQKGGGGIDPSYVKSLPLVSYCGGAKQLITDCPICLSEFEEREIIKLIPRCKHVFHPDCLDTWLSSHVSCPLCRSTQFSKAADDEVCLDVNEEDNGNGASELGGRSTVIDYDTCRDVGLRRACSCTNLGDHVVLRRSMSF